MIVPIIESTFENYSSITIKTPLETIEFSKEDYETKRVELEIIPNSNIMHVFLEDKLIVLFLNDVSITFKK